MTNAQRVAASVSGPDFHWIGSNVGNGAREKPLVLGVHPSGHVEFFAPSPQRPGSSVSHFSTTLFTNELLEPFDTGPKHDVGLALELMADLGWRTAPKNGTDIVFLLDLTGESGALIPLWVDRFPDIIAAWRNRNPEARFAIATHGDFPFAPHGTQGIRSSRSG